jgi:succinate dehydrogenase / fumarate reductase flavoprotein subunit
MTTIKIREAGGEVDRPRSLGEALPLGAQGGINAAVNTKGEGDSTAIHFDDTVYGGDFLANQPPVRAMRDNGPAIIFLLDRMVPFNRTSEGLLGLRRFGGTKHHRTAFAGATTGQQMLYALDEQVRRFEAAGKVQVRDLGVRERAPTSRDLAAASSPSTCAAMEVQLVADAVALATAAPACMRSTN